MNFAANFTIRLRKHYIQLNYNSLKLDLKTGLTGTTFDLDSTLVSQQIQVM